MTNFGFGYIWIYEAQSERKCQVRSNAFTQKLKDSSKHIWQKKEEHCVSEHTDLAAPLWVSALLPSDLPSELSVAGIIPAFVLCGCCGDTNNQSLRLLFDKVQRHGDSKSQEGTATHEITKMKTPFKKKKRVHHNKWQWLMQLKSGIVSLAFTVHTIMQIICLTYRFFKMVLSEYV